MPNLKNFMEQSGSEAEVLCKKRKTRSSSTPSPSVTDFFRPYPAAANPVVSGSAIETIDADPSGVFLMLAPELGADLLMQALVPTSRPLNDLPTTAFHDLYEGHACPPLARIRRVKITARKDRGGRMSAASHRQGIIVDIVILLWATLMLVVCAASSWSDSDFAEGDGLNNPIVGSEDTPATEPTPSGGVGHAGASSTPEATTSGASPSEGFSSLDPTALLVEFRHVRSGAILAKAEERLVINLNGLRAAKTAAEESCVEAKRKAVVSDAKAYSAEQGLAAALKDTAAIEERAASTLSQLAKERNRSATLVEELKIAQERLVVLEEKERSSFTMVAVYQKTFPPAELAAATDFKKVIREGLIVEPEDDDDPDLSFPISDIECSSDGKNP
ncbi:hypothetical protein L6164_023561 [Bauhinia variegata]|uniref:Uncharacterized protein n=1 Tax=Bauhinia variegata TaxID=167791 RepID=A0ACB9MJ12_BAUVA|nr:hypothetical protein L6164_023561 [Bauhinia variegata]